MKTMYYEYTRSTGILPSFTSWHEVEVEFPYHSFTQPGLLWHIDTLTRWHTDTLRYSCLNLQTWLEGSPTLLGGPLAGTYFPIRTPLNSFFFLYVLFPALLFTWLPPTTFVTWPFLHPSTPALILLPRHLPRYLLTSPQTTPHPSLPLKSPVLSPLQHCHPPFSPPPCALKRRVFPVGLLPLSPAAGNRLEGPFSGSLFLSSFSSGLHQDPL